MYDDERGGDETSAKKTPALASSAAFPMSTFREAQDLQGRIYYYNTTTKESVWELPENAIVLPRKQVRSWLAPLPSLFVFLTRE